MFWSHSIKVVFRYIHSNLVPRVLWLFGQRMGASNLVPRVSPLHERGETLVGAGHVSPKEKLDPGRGPSPASLCQDLLSTPKRGFRFAARSPHETHSTGYLFQWSSFCKLL